MPISLVHIVQNLYFCWREFPIEKQQFIHHHRGICLNKKLHKLPSDHHDTGSLISGICFFLCVTSHFSSIVIDSDTLSATCPNVVEHQMVPLSRDGGNGYRYIISSKVHLIPGIEIKNLQQIINLTVHGAREKIYMLALAVF